MIRCPACKADNAQGPACRRCKADLSLLFALEARRTAVMELARSEGAAGRWTQAYAAASEGEETSTIIAMGTGVLDRFGAGGLEASRPRS